MKTDLKDIFAKVQWANANCITLETKIESFLASKPYDIWQEENRKKGGMDYKIRFSSDVPDEIKIDISNILHLYRSGLDNLACALAKRNGRDSTKDVYFPICETEEGYSGSQRGAGWRKIKHLSQVDQAIIRSYQPYQSGCNDLTILHKLNVTDKHNKPLSPVGMLGHVGINQACGSIQVGGEVNTWGGLDKERVLLWSDSHTVEFNFSLKVMCKDTEEQSYVSIGETLKTIGDTVYKIIKRFEKDE